MNNIDERTGKPKIILDLCGGSGSWSRAYVAAGYDVRNITLPAYDVLTYEPPENVYGILAAPPLYGVFHLELQSGGTTAQPTGGIENCHGLPTHYRKKQARLVGARKSRGLFARVYGQISPHFPAVAVRRPMDKTDRDMGDIYRPRKEIFKLGGCSK